jgi:hypothetical protein
MTHPEPEVDPETEVDLTDPYAIARKIAEDRDEDVLLFNGSIEADDEHIIADACDFHRNHSNVLFILVTNGGDPHVAYKMARSLEQAYDRFTAFVVGPCKSAGTLLVAGANKLVISDRGELGPLDTQMRKSDELARMDSGLTVTEALGYLEDRAFNSFEQFFLKILRGSSGQISFKTATQVSTDLVVGLYESQFNQIDPMLLGEASRAIRISGDYADRLGRHGKNLKDDKIGQLVLAFASHGFVIDRDEACQFFEHVSGPDEMEKALEVALRVHGHTSVAGGDAQGLWVLSQPIEEPEEVGSGDEPDGIDEEQHDAATRNGHEATTNGDVGADSPSDGVQE